MASSTKTLLFTSLILIITFYLGITALRSGSSRFLSAIPFNAQAPISTVTTAMSTKDIIVSFKKTSSQEERKSILDDIVAKGGKVTQDENVGSAIFPFAVVQLGGSSFDALKALSLKDDGPIRGVEESQEVHTM